MGSSTVDFRGKDFIANDSALEVWLALLVREIDALGPIAEWLREARNEWELQATAGFGFGVTPALDQFVTDDQRRDLVVQLGQRALRWLESHGESIPRGELNALRTGGKSAIFLVDGPADIFLRTGQYFLKLLEGTLQPSESDSRNRPRA